MITCLCVFRVERCVVIVGYDSGDDDQSLISPDVCCVSLQQPDRVRSLMPLPTRMRYESAACVPPSGRQLYVTGVGQNMKETWKLDPESGWTRCADMNQDRRRHCATFVNDASMYVLGGMSNEHVILCSIEKYDVETNAWSLIGRLKYPTCLAACTVFNESIYVFGGRRTLQKASLGCV